jgi:membrane protease subunit (stomatin/prohibitin family)
MPAGHEKIEWADDGSEIARRLPERGTLEFRLGDQLIVREHQAAVVIHEGRGLDVFGPGRHTFAAVNLPVLTRVLRLSAGHRSAISAALYVISMKPIASLPWGGPALFELTDPIRGAVIVRAAGSAKVRVVQPLLFVNQVSRLRGADGPAAMVELLGEVVVGALKTLLAEGGVAQVPSDPAEVAAGLKARAGNALLRLGVELQEVTVSTLDLPNEAVRDAGPAAPGGSAPGPSPWTVTRAKTAGEAGFGSPFGHGFGLMTPGVALERIRRSDERPEGIHERRVVNCPACHSEVALTSRFCQQCGHQMVLINRCPACTTDLPAEARFCFHCGIRLDPA